MGDGQRAGGDNRYRPRGGGWDVPLMMVLLVMMLVTMAKIGAATDDAMLVMVVKMVAAVNVIFLPQSVLSVPICPICRFCPICPICPIWPAICHPYIYCCGSRLHSGTWSTDMHLKNRALARGNELTWRVRYMYPSSVRISPVQLSPAAGSRIFVACSVDTDIPSPPCMCASMDGWLDGQMSGRGLVSRLPKQFPNCPTHHCSAHTTHSAHHPFYSPRTRTGTDIHTHAARTHTPARTQYPSI